MKKTVEDGFILPLPNPRKGKPNKSRKGTHTFRNGPTTTASKNQTPEGLPSPDDGGGDQNGAKMVAVESRLCWCYSIPSICQVLLSEFKLGLGGMIYYLNLFLCTLLIEYSFSGAKISLIAKSWWKVCGIKAEKPLELLGIVCQGCKINLVKYFCSNLKEGDLDRYVLLSYTSIDAHVMFEWHGRSKPRKGNNKEACISDEGICSTDVLGISGADGPYEVKADFSINHYIPNDAKPGSPVQNSHVSILSQFIDDDEFQQYESKPQSNMMLATTVAPCASNLAMRELKRLVAVAPSYSESRNRKGYTGAFGRLVSKLKGLTAKQMRGDNVNSNCNID